MRAIFACFALCAVTACGGSTQAKAARDLPPVPSAPPPTAASTPPEAGGPTAYRDPDDAFDVTFPGAPRVQQEDEPIAGSAGELRSTFLTWSTDSRLLMVGKLRLLRIERYDCTRGLTGMRDLTLRNMGCSATAEKPTTLGGRPALDVEFACQKRPYRGRMRVACDASGVGTRHEAMAYSVMAMEQTARWNDEAARAFVDGFHLHPRP
jgi:hypothetical protein